MDREKINLEKVMDLRLAGKSFVSAASGLVKLGSDFFAVADDDLGVFSWPADSNDSVSFIKLRDGTLPVEHKARKAQKPDWESLVTLPDHSMLVVPSGSTPNRQLGFQIKFNNCQMISKTEIDFSDVYGFLNSKIADLNIEGSAVIGDTFKLFQRGNGAQGRNAVIDLNLAGVIDDISSARKIGKNRVKVIKLVELGLLGTAKLTFTDACVFKNQIYFLAAAEETASTYDDGKFIGAVLGLLNENNEVVTMFDLECPFKPEGLWIEEGASGDICYLVTDADDPTQPSGLYRAVLKN
jgi:hypothetical protein